MELFREVCRVMGLSPQIELGPWAQVRADLEEGRVDAVTGMNYSAARDELVDFTEPFILVTHAFFIRRGGEEVAAENLAGKEILVQRGDIMHDYLLEQGEDCTVIPVNSQIDALQLLSAGRYDAALLGKLQGHYNLEKEDIRNLRSSGASLLPLEYCFAVAEGNRELAERLNEGLAIVKMNGSYQRIYREWFGPSERRELRRTILLPLLWVVLPLLLILAGVILWNLSLKRRVIRATADLQGELRERLTAQKRLLAQEENFRTTLDSIGDGVITTDREGRVRRMNPVAAALTGYSSEQARGKPMEEVFDIFNAFTRERVENPVEIVLATGKIVGLANHTVLRAREGELYHIADSGAPIFNDRGEITGVVLVFRDVSREYAMRQDLREAKGYIDDIINSMPSLLAGVDREGRITLWNRRAEEETGIAAEEAYGRRADELIPLLGRLKETLDEALKEALRSGRVRTLPRVSEESPGGCRYKVATLFPLSGEEKEGAVIRIDDVSRQVDLEEQLAHTQKMKAVGQLAGGIAHDFNNTLGGIIGAAELLSGEMAPRERELVRIILDAAKGAAELTSKLLSFSSKRKLSVKTNDLHRILDDSVGILRRSIDKKVRIVVHKGADRAVIKGDEAQLQSAVMNIGINAAHAMPGGGEFLLSTRNIRTGEGAPRIELELRDTGEGIKPEHLSRIFDPFFTTKEMGGGTGLGLASVYGTVRSHEGEIRVVSVLGEGSAFFITLPLCPSEEPPRAVSSGRPAGQGLVLVVDDEAIIRTTTSAMLEKLRYRAAAAANGREALDLIARGELEPCLILLDLIMPVMGGAEAFSKLKALRPEIPIVITSGYSTDKDMRKIPREETAGVMNKPYGLEELSLVLQEALRGRPGKEEPRKEESGPA